MLISVALMVQTVRGDDSIDSYYYATRLRRTLFEPKAIQMECYLEPEALLHTLFEPEAITTYSV